MEELGWRDDKGALVSVEQLEEKIKYQREVAKQPLSHNNLLSKYGSWSVRARRNWDPFRKEIWPGGFIPDSILKRAQGDQVNEDDKGDEDSKQIPDPSDMETSNPDLK